MKMTESDLYWDKIPVGKKWEIQVGAETQEGAKEAADVLRRAFKRDKKNLKSKAHPEG